MFNYEIFDVIYKEFKKRCSTYLSDVIGTSQKYECGRYEINLFLCSHYEIDADSLTDFLNKEKEKFNLGLEDWNEFELCTGIIDHAVMMYCFYMECEVEMKTFEQFVFLAIN